MGAYEVLKHAVSIIQDALRIEHMQGTTFYPGMLHPAIHAQLRAAEALGNADIPMAQERQK